MICDSIINPHLCVLTKGQRSLVCGKLFLSRQYPPVSGQQGIHRDPNAIPSGSDASLFKGIFIVSWRNQYAIIEWPPFDAPSGTHGIFTSFSLSKRRAYISVEIRLGSCRCCVQNHILSQNYIFCICKTICFVQGIYFCICRNIYLCKTFSFAFAKIYVLHNLWKTIYFEQKATHISWRGTYHWNYHWFCFCFLRMTTCSLLFLKCYMLRRGY